MPREFELRMLDQATGYELWTLFRPGEPGYTPAGTGGVAVLGRLRSGASIAAAQRELIGIHRDSESGYARNAADFDVLVASLQADNTRTVRLTLIVVAGAVACLLLIACMNIAALWLGRAPGRTREAAIRVALGAGRVRLIRQSLAESLLLASIGGGCGLGLAMVAVPLFTAWNPLGVLPAMPIGIDMRALLFAGTITCAAAVLCGIAPALRAAATDPNEALRTGGDRGSSTAFARWSQTGLLAAQVAASVVLLVAMLLLVRSFARLQDESLGFDVSNMTVASLALPTAEFDSAVRAAVTSRILLTVAVGAAGGCAAAMILGTALEAVLYGVRPGDLVSFAASAAALLVVATGAAFAAASRATRISPVEVLRGN